MCLKVALVTLLAGSVRADSLKALRTASDSARSAVQRGIAAEDAEALASVFAENGCVVTPTGQLIRGKLTLRSMATLMMMTWGGGQLQLERDSLTVRDSTGYEIGRFSFKRAPKNQPEQSWSGGYTVVWEIEKGQWKVSRATGLLPRPGENPVKPDAR